MAVTKSKRIFYLNALRALAILAVIAVHVYAVTRAHVLMDFATGPSLRWLFSQFTGNNLRIGVDLFLMLSGALSLGRVWDIKTFLGKRIPRIVAPFLFWGFTLSLLLVVLSFYYPDALHSIKLYTINTFDIPSFLDYLYKSYLAKNVGFRPYWFFWMILGIYLIMPIFK